MMNSKLISIGMVEEALINYNPYFSILSMIDSPDDFMNVLYRIKDDFDLVCTKYGFNDFVNYIAAINIKVIDKNDVIKDDFHHYYIVEDFNILDQFKESKSLLIYNTGNNNHTCKLPDIDPYNWIFSTDFITDLLFVLYPDLNEFMDYSDAFLLAINLNQDLATSFYGLLPVDIPVDEFLLEHFRIIKADSVDDYDVVKDYTDVFSKCFNKYDSEADDYDKVKFVVVQ